MILRKRKEVFGHNQPEIVPQISTLILIDRNVDLMTPLSTQLTYEGLIDEIYNLKNCKMKRLYTKAQMNSFLQLFLSNHSIVNIQFVYP